MPNIYVEKFIFLTQQPTLQPFSETYWSFKRIFLFPKYKNGTGLRPLSERPKTSAFYYIDSVNRPFLLVTRCVGTSATRSTRTAAAWGVASARATATRSVA